MNKLFRFKIMVLCSIIGLTAFGFVGLTNAAIPVGWSTDIFIDAQTDTIADPLSVTVDEGLWCVAANDNEDAWNAWYGDVVGDDPYTQGWLNKFKIGVDGTVIAGGVSTVFGSEADAYDALVALGPLYFDVPAGVTEVFFWVKDTKYDDNVGGISLTLTKVPIPGAVWLLGSGLICLVGVRRKFRS